VRSVLSARSSLAAASVAASVTVDLSPSHGELSRTAFKTSSSGCGTRACSAPSSSGPAPAPRPASQLEHWILWPGPGRGGDSESYLCAHLPLGLLLVVATTSEPRVGLVVAGIKQPRLLQ
jgi:hypothetical protein